MTRLCGQPVLPGPAHEDPAPAPRPDTFLRGRPSLPSPSSHLAAAGLPGRRARRTETNFPGKRETRAGRSGAGSGLPPPLAGSPGGGRPIHAPRAAAEAAPAAGARPGSASWGGSEGRGADGRAHAGGRGRAAGAGPGRDWNDC